jgi:hypothetical protein
MTPATNLPDPRVEFLGHPEAGPEFAQLDLACRFYGFQLAAVPVARDRPLIPLVATDGSAPTLVVVQAGALGTAPAEIWRDLLASADRAGVPIAVLGIDPETNPTALAALVGGAATRAVAMEPATGLWVVGDESVQAGFALRGIRLALSIGRACRLEIPAAIPTRVLAKAGSSEPDSQPVFLRLEREKAAGYLLARTAGSAHAWQFDRGCFGDIAPLMILLREVGGARCWLPPAALANLTIDDPWLTEPYGCLSYPGLLATNSSATKRARATTSGRSRSRCRRSMSARRWPGWRRFTVSPASILTG